MSDFRPNITADYLRKLAMYSDPTAQYTYLQCADRIAELEAELEQFRWVSVEERLPEYGKLVLTLSDNGPEVDYLKTSDKFTQDHPTDCGMPVTHWMPLPAPPKE